MDLFSNRLYTLVPRKGPPGFWAAPYGARWGLPFLLITFSESLAVRCCLTTRQQIPFAHAVRYHDKV